MAGWCLSYSYICFLPLLEIQNIHARCRICRVLTTWGKTAHLASRTYICGKSEQGSSKPIKQGRRGSLFAPLRQYPVVFSQIHRGCVNGMKFCILKMVNDESRGMHDEMTVFCLQVLPRHLPAANEENHCTLSWNISCKREFNRVTAKPVNLLIYRIKLILKSCRHGFNQFL